MPFFWCKFGFGKCFGASSWSNHWVGHHWLSYKIYFLVHDTIRSRNGLLLLHRIREDDNSKWRVFWFVVSSWGTHLSSFFTFPICFKCQRLSLSSLAPFHVVARGLVLMMALNCCQLLIAGCYAPHLQSSRLLCETSWPPQLLCTFVTSSWAKCVVDVVSCLHCFTTHFELG